MSGKFDFRAFGSLIAAFKPEYFEDGDGTEVYTAKGKLFKDKRRIKSFRKALCRFYVFDYEALRSYYRGYFSTGLTPIPVRPGYTLMPVKTRTARCKGDPCYGYINVQLIEDISSMRERDGGGCFDSSGVKCQGGRGSQSGQSGQGGQSSQDGRVSRNGQDGRGDTYLANYFKTIILLKNGLKIKAVAAPLTVKSTRERALLLDKIFWELPQAAERPKQWLEWNCLARVEGRKL